jgi:membrane protein YqaA with SNARE-associated domain
MSSLSPVLKILFAPSKIMRKMYDWTIHWSKTKYAKISLFGLAFAESSFFVVPPDVLLIAMTVANRYKWWIYASIATTGSVLGGVLGYYIGLFFFQTAGQPIVDFYHLQGAFDKVGMLYKENAFLAVFTAAFTPIPYKMFTIGGGFFQIPLEQLVIGSLLGRSARFFAVSGIIRVFGKQISNAIEKYFDLFSLIFMVLLIGGFIIVKFL